MCLLGSYADAHGRARQLLALSARGGSVLVLDRDAATLGDRRLIAHLAADEPFENAQLICRHYLADTRRPRCRRVSRSDLEREPPSELLQECNGESPTPPRQLGAPGHPRDREGRVYQLRPLRAGRAAGQLRWCRRPAQTTAREWEPVALREAIGALESYEPLRALTQRAVADAHDGSVRRLRAELDRLHASSIVLNRCLREAVLEAIAQRGMTMSEIALRCGILKRDSHGRASGETSWLARRVGLMPEGGMRRATPWIHSDVLAAIARDGLGISPREVELQ